MPARAADLDASSAVDAVTVYPDGASVTRVITLDLPAGDNTLVSKDFPLTLDPSSLRVEGEAGAKLTIGAIDARPPRAAPPVNLPELDKRIEALKDERADLQGAIECRRRAAQIRRALCGSLAGRNWRQGRGASDRRMARGLCRGRRGSRRRRYRDPRRRTQAARHRPRNRAARAGPRAAKPPSKLEVRIDLAAAAATKATLRVTYAVRNARWTPLYDARLDTGAKDRKPALELVRRAEITQNTGEDWSNVALARFHRAHRARRQRAGSEFADRAISATAAADRGRQCAIDACRRTTACGSSALQAGAAMAA